MFYQVLGFEEGVWLQGERSIWLSGDLGFHCKVFRVKGFGGIMIEGFGVSGFYGGWSEGIKIEG